MKRLTQLTIKICLYLSLFQLLFYNAQGQTKNNIKQLRLKIEKADSVILISHELTFGYAPIIKPDLDITDISMNLKKREEQNPSPLDFLEKGKVNRKITREYFFLNDSNKTKLTKVLLRQVLLNRANSARCFFPRHTIIIYKNNKESYIDICFGCRKISISNDIYFSELYMDNKKWNDLENFFKRNGLTQIFMEHDE